MRLTFLGANRQVTGSRSLLEVDGFRVMIDCGLFQEREHLFRNWEAPVDDPGSIDVLLLTHAHLDHCGLTPRLVADGFDGSVITTKPSADLAELIMLDSARIQEEDAEYKRKRHRKEGRRGRHPETPLYDSDDAARAVKRLRGVEYGEPVRLSDRVSAVFHESGHILGSATIVLTVEGDDGSRRIAFSGDIGQWGKPIIGDPTLLDEADYVVMESTYGDRDHGEEGTIQAQLESIVNETVERGGNVVIPTFAVERAQELIYDLGRLIDARRIPRLPIFLDSPMAVDATEIFLRHRRWMDDEARALFESGRPPLRLPNLVLARSRDDSMRINAHDGPAVIMSTSGMCTAGRIKHHLRRHVGRKDSTILFVGYQARGTLGREIMKRRKKVRIHGRMCTVRARTARLFGCSAHADRGDLLRWIRHLRRPPRGVFLVHGDEDAAASLARRIDRAIGVRPLVPAFGYTATLD